jgi:diguanylate cyclase (GGDEF)-like protein
LIGVYDPGLVLASYAVAVGASYAALKCAGRITASRGSARRWWLGCGALAMGFGIWSMHFIGMLAFRLPIPIGYDPVITVLSALVSIGGAGYALAVVSTQAPSWRRLAGAALVMGGAIAAMHYLGMASMRMQPPIRYEPGWLLASIFIAVIAAGTALGIAYRLRDDHNARVRLVRLSAALVMGMAIVGMHYTGMMGARLDPDAICGAVLGAGISRETLATLVICIDVAVVGTAIVVAALDRQLNENTERLAASLHSANQRLTHLAMHDPLTGLPNRLLLSQRLEQLVEHARAGHSHCAVLFVDLDGFKAINDAFGHSLGDSLLVRVAGAIAGLLEGEALVTRLGGDEFVVVAPVADRAAAAALAERIRATISQVLYLDAYELQVTASIGVAVCPHDGEGSRDLLANADAAMYHVKQGGRNAVGFYAPAMRDDGQTQLILDLRHAVERGQLLLHYQPQILSCDASLARVEALVRWQHPTLGMISPQVFIPLAERQGLILEIGAWVLEEACRQWAAWQVEGAQIPGVAVNLSAVQFRSQALVAEVTRAMQRHGLPAHALTLEITETTAMQDPERSLQILDRLVEAGARISIDDFGTGYSSLSHLARMPAHELKIDRQFVQQMAPGSRYTTIVRSVAALGHQLGLAVVAEGVETAEQQAALVALRCDLLQGFHLGRPMPASDVARRFLAPSRQHAYS